VRPRSARNGRGVSASKRCMRELAALTEWVVVVVVVTEWAAVAVVVVVVVSVTLAVLGCTAPSLTHHCKYQPHPPWHLSSASTIFNTISTSVTTNTDHLHRTNPPPPPIPPTHTHTYTHHPPTHPPHTHTPTCPLTHPLSDCDHRIVLQVRVSRQHGSD
jgi:hypothetical protein